MAIQKAKIMGIQNKKYNTYDLSKEYGIGYTSNTNELFYFDIEDYNLIKNYCWEKDSRGYIATKINNAIIFMHRLVMNCPDNMDIDHIYHNTWDNRKNEMRIVTESQNAMNRKIYKNNTSGVKGVGWNKLMNKWHAYITVNKVLINLGYYDNFNDAVEIRKYAEDKYFGEYNYKENPESTDSTIDNNSNII